MSEEKGHPERHAPIKCCSMQGISVEPHEQQKEWDTKAHPNYSPRKVAEEINLIDRNRANQLGRKLSVFDFIGEFPHEVADDEAADHKHRQVILHDVGFVETGDCVCTHRAHPYEGHGEHGECVGEDPNDAIDAIGNSVF